MITLSNSRKNFMNPTFLIITDVPAPAVIGVAGSLLTSQNHCFGGWRLEAGGWRLEAGGWRLEAGGWRLEAGGWRLEAGGWRRCHYPQFLPFDLVKPESFRTLTQL
jgi:hypothetical protein